MKLKSSLLLPLCAAIMSVACPGRLAANPIDETIKKIIAASPDLQSQNELIEAQRLTDADANSLSNPEIEFARVWGRHGIGNKLQLDVSQSFQWPGVYRANARAAQRGISAAEMLMRSSALDISLEAKQLMVELVYVKKQIALLDDMLANVDTLASIIDKGFRQGELTILDKRKIEMERLMLENQHTPLLQRQQQIESSLRGMAPGAELPLANIAEYPVEPLLSLDEYTSQLKTLDPLYASQSLTAEQEQLNANAARMSRFPTFSLGYQHQAEMGDRFNGFTAAVTLPFFENRHARRAALLRKSASEHSSEMTLAKRSAEIASTYSESEILRNQIASYNKIMGDNAYLSLLEKAYRGGELDVVHYLTEVNYYQGLVQEYLSVEYQYRQALTSLNRYNLLPE